MDAAVEAAAFAAAEVVDAIQAAQDLPRAAAATQGWRLGVLAPGRCHSSRSGGQLREAAQMLRVVPAGCEVLRARAVRARARAGGKR